MRAGDQIAEGVAALPLGSARDALAEVPAYLVGGAVRELLRGAVTGPELDVAIDGELEDVLRRLDSHPEIEVAKRHERFGTATVRVDGTSIDLTRTRRETYPAPGALPLVEPAGIDPDLARRDFTVNALAIPLATPGDLLDPFGGRADLESGTLRVLHERSFVDDPTRAIRGARYAARLGLTPDVDTLALARMTDLGTVSADRRDAELARLAAEPSAGRGFELLAEWGLLRVPPGTTDLIEAVADRSSRGPWRDRPEVRAAAILLAVAGGEGLDAAGRLALARPGRPSESVRIAAHHGPAELLLAAAAGGTWVDDYVSEWSEMKLEIDGDDLIAAGIPEGPAIGAGLRGALERKLDGGLTGGREEELEVALAIARGAI